MPTDPAALRAELDNRGLVMLGAFVPVALKNASAHAAGIANAVKTARLLAAVAATAGAVSCAWRTTTGRCRNEPVWRGG